jgi:hypothetical protein
MKNSDSYLILEQLIQKRLLVIKPAELITWLNNLERTGQITEQENKDLLTLAEQLNIYNLPLTEYTFLMLRTDLYLHPSMLPTLDCEQNFRVRWSQVLSCVSPLVLLLL